MADVALPASMTPGGIAGERRYTTDAAVTIVAGNLIVLDSSGNWILADADLHGAYAYIALNDGLAGDPVAAIIAGVACGFAGLTPGVTYYLSNTAGRMCLLADVGAGTNFVPVGVALDATRLEVQSFATQLPNNTLAIASPAQGEVPYFNGTNWAALAVGSPEGLFLQTGGAAENPVWAAPLMALNAAITTTNVGVSSTVFFTFDLPTNVSAVVKDVGFSALTVGAAGATIDVLEDGTTILSAPIDVGVGEVKGAVTDTAIAAGATITAKYTTGASTGAIGNGNLTILLGLVDAS